MHAPAVPFLRGRPWRLALVKGAIVYVLSRFVVLAAAGLVAAADAYRSIVNVNEGLVGGSPRPTSAAKFVTQLLTSWDGLWYLLIVRKGYPRNVVNPVTYYDDSARAAFFPGFPLLVRAVDHVLPGGDTAAALLLNLVLGGLFILLVGLLARRFGGDRLAGRSMMLAALFPGSFVLSFAYSEALFTCLAAAALLLLLDRRWLLAGTVSALATATRPNGLALVLACTVAAVAACRGPDRWRLRWRPIAAVLLSPLGFVAFQIFLASHTGERTVWFRVQRQAWGEGASYGLAAITKTVEFTVHPFHSAVNVVTALCVVATIGCLVALWKAKLPAVVNAYTIGIVAMMLMPATVTARPRFLFTAFPLLIAFAKVWPKKDDDWWVMLLALSGAGLLGATTLYGLLAAIP
jgi:Gpi18-like mannosyltransferase